MKEGLGRKKKITQSSDIGSGMHMFRKGQQHFKESYPIQ